MLGWLLAVGCLRVAVGGLFNSVVIFISYLFGGFGVVVLRFDVVILIFCWSGLVLLYAGRLGFCVLLISCIVAVANLGLVGLICVLLWRLLCDCVYDDLCGVF